ncbi:MAG: ATP-binding cassette domain-containing protein [Candidatus Fermentibacteraceae bacterium]|nr:ATP-binding cassette domain-containing protein [Candidatus Fermentibacteraceae bacterium]MBN2608107.1 ATP-binding cassette domain-containing protein [Candidatus Fermentibacteraceae bacterium]
MKGISFAYGSKNIVRDLDLELSPGETLMITGPNGVGKSTILRLLAGVLIPSSGSIEYGFPEGADPRSRIAYLPDSLSCYRSMTPPEAAAFHAGIFGTQPSGLSIASKAGVDLNRKISELSLGQRVIVQLSIILSTGPDLVLIDEVLHSVDPYLRGLLFQELVKVMEERAPTVVMVNLNFSEVENLVDRVIFMGKEGIRLDDSVDDLKAGARMIEAESLSAGLPVIIRREVLGRNQFVIYPFTAGEEDVEKPHPMDLTEIMTAFMEAEYVVDSGTKGEEAC